MADDKEWGNNSDIGPKNPQQITLKSYVVDFMIQGSKNMVRTFLNAPNENSLLAVATIMCAVSIQQIYGFNAYLATDPKCPHMDPEKCKDLQFLIHAPAMDVISMISPGLSKATGRQVVPCAVPVINPTSEQFTDMVREAREKGLTK